MSRFIEFSGLFGTVLLDPADVVGVCACAGDRTRVLMWGGSDVVVNESPAEVAAKLAAPEPDAPGVRDVEAVVGGASFTYCATGKCLNRARWCDACAAGMCECRAEKAERERDELRDSHEIERTQLVHRAMYEQVKQERDEERAAHALWRENARINAQSVDSERAALVGTTAGMWKAHAARLAAALRNMLEVDSFTPSINAEHAESMASFHEESVEEARAALAQYEGKGGTDVK